jgi:hypothetical protein
MARARPKSVSFAVPLTPRRMFDGETSRWMMGAGSPVSVVR